LYALHLVAARPSMWRGTLALSQRRQRQRPRCSLRDSIGQYPGLISHRQMADWHRRYSERAVYTSIACAAFGCRPPFEKASLTL
jgi:hypothetical protein